MIDWKAVNLGTILSESKVESITPDSSKRIRVKLNLGGIERRPDINEKKGATKYYTRKAGQFIYGRQNLHKGAFGIVPFELDGCESSADLPAFDVSDNCFPEWIFYFFKQADLYKKLSALAKGVGSKRINPKQLFGLQILLPSKEEQRKILDSVKTFEVDALHLKIELEKQISLLENIKSVFLSEALEGKHETNTKENKLKNWKVLTMGEYVICERGRFSARPRNDPKFFNGKIPYIQIGNLPSEGGYILNHDQTLNESGLSVSKLFPKNTIAIAIVGATIGNTGILDYDMCFPDSLIGIKPSDQHNTRFLEYFLRSKKDYFRTLAYSGGGQPNIKLPTIKNCEILVPPIAEQKLIVDKISKVFKNCNELIENIKNQIKDVDLLFKTELSKIWKSENIISNNSMMKSEINIRTYQVLLDTLKLTLEDENIVEIQDILEKNGKMSAVSVWQISRHRESIDSFYDELKILIEDSKTVKESKEKGYIEIVL
ncbi:hypothetical protein FNW52_16885 [Flavobacterium sp. ZT3R18]|uniref:restriction endonuclease subunit S n=1 Tax=Flavobacterium sp. ZT3R18 TaxID=2594429 RepID=UPI00117BC6B3|nr:restriction endonuclease subunit S [Flavobacterium sp. ZT3R18]TRX32561.1 hypothetical protein FNW52_16885 [Flavobacterium sp. ZT3R18]